MEESKLTSVKKFSILDYGAKADGKTLNTEVIQQAIDEANQVGGMVWIPKGTFLTGSLFLKSDIVFHMDEGAILLGSTREEDYEHILTRVGGIEMIWPAGIININHAKNVVIEGKGTIDGQGQVWWFKYWGKDKKGGMRGIYEKKNLRWAVDYDCTRVRNLVAFESQNLTIRDVHLKRSGFWNLHICYCEDVTISKVVISDNQGPSTDGIDIDSSRHVEVDGCRISCNDDDICLKAGRDADGLRVNRPCEDIYIHDCHIYEGEGITIGSETSGGIFDVRINDCDFHGSKQGFRVKSAKTRGGTIDRINLSGLLMEDVHCLFSMEMNWYPKYSYGELEEEDGKTIPEHWRLLCEQVPLELGLPSINKISIEDVKAKRSQGCIEKLDEEAKIFQIEGLAERPINNLSFSKMTIENRSFGEVKNVKELFLDQISFYESK